MANRDLEDLLASDDELPNAYEEDADLPAYQNDNRFDIIDFPWINNKKDVSLDLSNKSKDLPKLQAAKAISITTATKNVYYKKESREKKLILKGILNKCDIFSVKCIASFSTDTTLLWFINFLMQKDMLSDYNFLKSCLVEDFVRENSLKREQSHFDRETNHLQIVVK